MKLPVAISIEPKTGFPVVAIPQTNYALSWLPVTKLQIEYFLCETMDSQFDRNWYLERLRNNPRVTTAQLTVGNFRQTFMTNVLFHEARVLIREWGNEFDLPTVEEWHHALQAFDRIEAQEDFVEEVAAMSGLHLRARLLLSQVEHAAKNLPRPRTMPMRLFSHQLLMRSGISEYVYKDEHRNTCLACGSTQRFAEQEHTFEESFLTQLRSAQTGDRVPTLGFRLLMRT
jgi:hypothetical protein